MFLDDDEAIATKIAAKNNLIHGTQSSATGCSEKQSQEHRAEPVG